MNEIISQFKQYPTFFPTITSIELSKWIDVFEQMFKQPIKNVFSYPLDVIKIFDKDTHKIKALEFKIALAGLSKENIIVQLRKRKFLTIKVKNNNLTENKNEDYSFVTKGISYRDSEITFRIIPDIDVSSFKPSFINGLLTIRLNIKENNIDDDIITAEIN